MAGDEPNSPLQLRLLDPPKEIVSGRRVSLVAEIHNISSSGLTVTVDKEFSGTIFDSEGMRVGGSFGFRALLAAVYYLEPGQKAQLLGGVEARQASPGMTAALLPRGRYTLRVILRIHVEHLDGTAKVLTLASDAWPLEVVTRISPS